MSTTTDELPNGTVITEDLRPQWLAQRQKSIGASEAAAAIGANPYQSPIELWQVKTGRRPPFEGNEATHWGTLLEPLILDEYERQVACIRDRQLFCQHRDYPWLTCTLDGIRDDCTIVEAKAAGEYSREWGDPDDEDPEIPLAYRLQLHHQMLVMASEAADLAVLRGGNRFKVYHVSRDEQLIKAMLPALERFWGCVVRDEPPDWGKLTPADLAILNPSCEGRAEWSDGQAEEVRIYVERIEEAKRIVKDHEDAIDSCKVEVLKALGSAEFGVLPGGRKVKRYVNEVAAAVIERKAYTSHYFRVLKGGK